MRGFWHLTARGQVPETAASGGGPAAELAGQDAAEPQLGEVRPGAERVLVLQLPEEAVAHPPGEAGIDVAERVPRGLVQLLGTGDRVPQQQGAVHAGGDD